MMDEFIQVNSWYEQKYRAKSGERYFTFKVALNMLKSTKGVNIVETGTTRMVEDWGAGMSTVLFADFIRHYGGHLWTIDISEPNINVCKIVTEEYKDLIDYVVSDSHLFLSTFDKPIDLLYLDSYDYPLEGDPTECQQFQLKEFKLVERLLGKFSIILLDDNGFPNGGKTKLTKEYLLEKGWTCLLDYQQSVWIK